MKQKVSMTEMLQEQTILFAKDKWKIQKPDALKNKIALECEGKRNAWPSSDLSNDGEIYYSLLIYYW